MIQFASYMLFKRDHSQVKRGGVMVDRKTPRYNLQAVAGYWSGTDKLRTSKGEIYLNLIPKDKDHSLSADSPEYRLQVRPATNKTSINLTGLRLEFMDDTELVFASGEPLQSQQYKNEVNPLYEERMDGFLFVLSKEPQRAEVLEMFVLSGEQPLIDAHRKRMALGGYNEEIEAIRSAARAI